MPIGETLAAARHQAGLTVAEVSERTRIRPTIIRAIEDNDYTSCGGDFYARGNIRDIARVVGIDPEPLIREYDAAHRAPGALSTVSLDELLTVSGGASGRRRAAPRRGSRRRRRGAGALAVRGGGPRGGGPDHRAALAPPVRGGPGGGVGPFRGTAPPELDRPAGRGADGGARLRRLPLPVQPAADAGGPVGGQQRHVTDHDATAGAPKPPGRPARHLRPYCAVFVRYRTVAARGRAVPGRRRAGAAAGPGQRLGLRPGRRRRPAERPAGHRRSSRGGWLTDWYTTARFGNLYSGTGLLLDMGHPVTLTAAQIALGTARGASVQLRVGAAPALADLHAVAHKAGTGGVVRFRLASPARGRYVLIWFTRLPPDPAGTFRAEVWNVRLEGRS